MKAMGQASRHRLFLGLSPEAGSGAELEQLAQRLAWDSGGHALSGNQLHLTLLFLGEVSAEMVDPIQSALDGLEVASFPLVGDKLSFRQEQSLIWLGVSHPEPELLRLQREIRAAMKTLKVAYNRKRFHPHVTLVRGVQHMPENLDFVPSRWMVGRFQLLESVPSTAGHTYRVLKEWPLRTAPPLRNDSMVIKLSPADVDSVWLRPPLENQAA